MANRRCNHLSDHSSHLCNHDPADRLVSSDVYIPTSFLLFLFFFPSGWGMLVGRMSSVSTEAVGADDGGRSASYAF